MAALSLPEAKGYLKIAATDEDDKITAAIVAAEAAIVSRIGPIEPTATTARVRGGTLGMRLPVSPAISLTTVTPVGGTALTIADLYLSREAAVVTRNDGAALTATFYDVVYQAGRASVPDDLLEAIKALVKHMWQPLRGPTTRPGSQPEGLSSTLPESAYTFPFRVNELLAPYTPVLVSC